jgi:hypothetical protein
LDFGVLLGSLYENVLADAINLYRSLVIICPKRVHAKIRGSRGAVLECIGALKAFAKHFSGLVDKDKCGRVYFRHDILKLGHLSG